MANTTPDVFLTLEEGLNFHTVDELKKLLALLPIKEKPKRKAELVAAIAPASTLCSQTQKNLERPQRPSASCDCRSRACQRRLLLTRAIPGKIR